MQDKRPDPDTLLARMTDLRHTLLLIEDELSIRRVLCAALHASGYHVITAATAQEGCTQAARCQPALILLDLGLPDLDGLEVTRRLREWATMPRVWRYYRTAKRCRVGV